MPKPKEPPYREGEHTQMALMAQDIRYIKNSIDELKKEVEGKYVTSVEFEPIKKLVYGMVGLILVSVVTIIMSMITRQGQ